MSGSGAECQESPQELSAEIVKAAEAALALFKKEHWQEPVPVLDTPAQLAIRAYFDSREMIATANCYPSSRADDNPFLDEELQKPRNLASVLSLHDRALVQLSNHDDAVAGPYFLGGEYIPEGAAIWRTKEAVRQKDHPKQNQSPIG